MKIPERSPVDPRVAAGTYAAEIEARHDVHLDDSPIPGVWEDEDDYTLMAEEGFRH